MRAGASGAAGGGFCIRLAKSERNGALSRTKDKSIEYAGTAPIHRKQNNGKEINKCIQQAKRERETIKGLMILVTNVYRRWRDIIRVRFE